MKRNTIWTLLLVQSLNIIVSTGDSTSSNIRPNTKIDRDSVFTRRRNDSISPSSIGIDPARYKTNLLATTSSIQQKPTTTTSTQSAQQHKPRLELHDDDWWYQQDGWWKDPLAIFNDASNINNYQFPPDSSSSNDVVSIRPKPPSLPLESSTNESITPESSSSSTDVSKTSNKKSSFQISDVKLMITPFLVQSNGPILAMIGVVALIKIFTTIKNHNLLTRSKIWNRKIKKTKKKKKRRKNKIVSNVEAKIIETIATTANITQVPVADIQQADNEEVKVWKEMCLITENDNERLQEQCTTLQSELLDLKKEIEDITTSKDQTLAEIRQKVLLEREKIKTELLRVAEKELQSMRDEIKTQATELRNRLQ